MSNKKSYIGGYKPKKSNEIKLSQYIQSQSNVKKTTTQSTKKRFI